MSDHVYKTIEITGTSRKSAEDAISVGIEKAAQSLHNLRWFRSSRLAGRLQTERSITGRSRCTSDLHSTDFPPICGRHENSRFDLRIGFLWRCAEPLGARPLWLPRVERGRLRKSWGSRG